MGFLYLLGVKITNLYSQPKMKRSLVKKTEARRGSEAICMPKYREAGLELGSVPKHSLGSVGPTVTGSPWRVSLVAFLALLSSAQRVSSFQRRARVALIRLCGGRQPPPPFVFVSLEAHFQSLHA